jgi:uncharacterized protein
MAVSIIYQRSKMKFYDREVELKKLDEIQLQSLQLAQMTAVTGRRRIGKTQLLLRSTEGKETLYFFVARKSEQLLCLDFQQEISEKLNIPFPGEINQFSRLFEYLMILSKERSFSLIIDEFQEFYNVSPSAYSEIQHYWDIHKDKSKINLIVSGSINSLMNKIFKNAKEPLFGRATNYLHIKPFTTKTLKNILFDHNPHFVVEDLLALYIFTGGVAKYVQLLMDNKVFDKEAMLNFIIREDSSFISDGKNILIEEFGKEYAIYFSILSCIARGENTRNKIESCIKREIGGYLTKLENDYQVIAKIAPIYSKVETKNIRYELIDNYLTFWFRFIFKYSYIIEIGGYDNLRKIVERDYATYSGKMLERYFKTFFAEEQTYTRIGSFWDRKGENEIDLILVNELNEQIDFVEIKRNPENIDSNKLRKKASHFLTINGELRKYKIGYKELSINDM